MATTTYLPGVSATSQLLLVKNNDVIVTDVDNTAGEFITLQIYTLTETAVGSVYTFQDNSITTDGAGNFTAFITMPTTPGQYYLQWDMQLGSPLRVGKFTYLFQVRTKL